MTRKNYLLSCGVKAEATRHTHSVDPTAPASVAQTRGLPWECRGERAPDTQSLGLLAVGIEEPMVPPWSLVRTDIKPVLPTDPTWKPVTDRPHLQGALFLCRDFLTHHRQSVVQLAMGQLHLAPSHVNGIWRVLLTIYSACTSVTLKLKLSWYETKDFGVLFSGPQMNSVECQLVDIAE